MNRRVLNTLVSVTLAAAAPFALAQEPREAPHARHHGAQHQQHGQRAFTLPSERVEARLAYLKTALRITDAQEPQWEAFAGTLRKQARDMDERIKARRAQMTDAKRDVQPTAIERLERRQARLAAASARHAAWLPPGPRLIRIRVAKAAPRQPVESRRNIGAQELRPTFAGLVVSAPFL